MTFESDIENIVATIWSTLIDTKLECGVGAAANDETTVTGIVNIEGAWHGAVLLRCPLALASLVTTTMFQGEDEPTLDEVRDALGELTNMVAGNIKALLPEPSAISLPTVVFGSHYEIRVLGTHDLATVPFRTAGHSLVVSVVQRSRDDAAGRR
jgi:chemotaxis protein CheX